jgi:hypothetical protein
MKTSKWIGLLVGIVALLLGFGGSLGAQTKSACADDAAKFGKDATDHFLRMTARISSACAVVR